jgi:sucrose-6-phosphate hydrolase SacC (GH32 family)
VLCQQVTFENVVFDKSDNGCRVKAHANGTGLVSGITYRNVTMSDVLWPILVDGFYGSGSQGGNAVKFESITFDGVSGTASDSYFSKDPIKFHCDETMPCKGIVMNDVDIRGVKKHQKVKMSCENVHGRATNVSPPSCLEKAPLKTLDEVAPVGPYRPAIHFVPQLANGTVGLPGDPNGLLFDHVHEVYHQFFQWAIQGNEVWGHVSSTDLVNWRQHPIALQNPNYGTYSGSGAILSDAARTPVLSFAVSTHMSIGLAVPVNRSDPDLAEWKVLPPIITTTHCTGPPDALGSNDTCFGAPRGEDPTSLWPASDGKSWLVGYAAEPGCPKGDSCASKSHGTWDQPDLMVYRSQGAGVASLSQPFSPVGVMLTGKMQCLDFHALPKSQAQPGSTHIFISRNTYAIGTYDASGVKFHPNPKVVSTKDKKTSMKPLDAGHTYSGKAMVDPANDRLLMIVQIYEDIAPNVGHPDHGFSGGYQSVESFPRVLTLAADGVTLLQQPVPELAMLRVAASRFAKQGLSLGAGKTLPITGVTGAQMELRLNITASGNATLSDCGVSVLRTMEGEHLDIGVLKGGELYADGSRSSHNSSGQSGWGNTTYTTGVGLTSDKSVDVTVIVDHSVVEVYADGGAAVISKRAYPLGSGSEVQLFSRGSGGTGCTFDVIAWSMRSSGKKPLKADDDVVRLKPGAKPARKAPDTREVLAHLGSTPTIDGTFAPGEWSDAYTFDTSQAPIGSDAIGPNLWTAYFDNVTDAADLSLTGYCKRDKSSLYFGFNVTDNFLVSVITGSFFSRSRSDFCSRAVRNRRTAVVPVGQHGLHGFEPIGLAVVWGRNGDPDQRRARRRVHWQRDASV